MFDDGGGLINADDSVAFTQAAEALATQCESVRVSHVNATTYWPRKHYKRNFFYFRTKRIIFRAFSLFRSFLLKKRLKMSLKVG